MLTPATTSSVKLWAVLHGTTRNDAPKLSRRRASSAITGPGFSVEVPRMNAVGSGMDA